MIREAAVSAVPSMIAAMDRIIDAQVLAVAKKDHLAFLAPIRTPPQHSNTPPLQQFTALVFEHEDEHEHEDDVYDPL